MRPTYDPKQVEARWYQVWESAGYFSPEINPDGDPFCIVIPPPNVTGSLHMGHALDLSIQDVIVRRKRMQGYAALWVPGTDHAGIATQSVVERELAAEGLTRQDLGRDRFVEEVWAWREKSGGRITRQIRTLGFSLDWTRERFTLDEGLSRAVREVFVTLYEAGLIYRASRIINWCPACNTAISDIEVDYEDVPGELVYIRYPFSDGSGGEGIVVATTRAETMLGDAAVAVHPDDRRYRAVVGRTVRLPLMGRVLPVVADDAVDPDFGTGAVKVTPAHDPLDFEIAGRHDLAPVQILDENARITSAGGRFAGLDRFAAREAVKDALRAEGAIVKVEDRVHSVGHCSRSEGVQVEPLLSLQWFVKVRPLVVPAVEAVRNGDTRFIPRRWEKNYFHWMENIRDWCISRQLWWGHRIPAWYCDECTELMVSRDEPQECAACGHGSLTADPDVLDTWFSSALWPFSTLGWPDDTEDLRAFYPNDVLVTGFDIIYFWVARMMKMGLRFMGDEPFGDVVIHGLVRAADGRKMSKSHGNALDPVEVVAEHGADALRLALIQAAAPGHDVPIREEWVVAARRFGNKLWNAARFALPHAAPVPPEGGYPDDPAPEARWILHRLGEVAASFDELMDDYRFSDAYGLLYNFAWAEVFDWYIELAKAPLRHGGGGTVSQALGVVLRDVLKLFHPVIPFLTEELWSELVGGGSIMISAWPRPPAYAAAGDMASFQELIGGLRSFRADHGLSPRREMEVVVASDGDGIPSWWHQQAASLAAVRLVAGDAPRGAHTRIGAGFVEAYVSLEGIVDLDTERVRLDRAIADTSRLLERSQTKLGNAQFRARAPQAVVDSEEARAADLESRVERLRAQRAELG